MSPPPEPPAPFAPGEVTALTKAIEATHHSMLWAELPRLSTLAVRVTDEAVQNPVLVALLATFESLRLELEAHLAREEQIVFPFMREIDAAVEVGRLPVGELGNSITVMTDEHAGTNDLLDRLRQLSDDFTAPDGATDDHRALFDGLTSLVGALDLLIRTESTVLFPAALALEEHCRTILEASQR